MCLTNEEKSKLLKAFTGLMKKVRGKGPRNLYVKELDDVVNIYFEGAVNIFENNLLEYYGDETRDIILDLYKKVATVCETEEFTDLKSTLNLKYTGIDCDLDQDKFIYRMEYNSN